VNVKEGFVMWRSEFLTSEQRVAKACQIEIRCEISDHNQAIVIRKSDRITEI
jgi:hypothetical protein